jgi:hypothetical protein
MNATPSVLIISRDEMLCSTRKMILSAALEVDSAQRAEEANRLIAIHGYDLIVICHSISDLDCEVLSAAARKQTHRPGILAMVESPYDGKPWADDTQWSGEGPYALLEKCAKMLGIVLESRAREFRFPARNLEITR